MILVGLGILYYLYINKTLSPPPLQFYMVDVVERVQVLSYDVYNEDLVGLRFSKLIFLSVIEIELTFEVAFNEFNPTPLQRQVDLHPILFSIPNQAGWGY